MQIFLDTTIHELFDGKQISARTYNCLRYAGMVTLEDVLNYAESPEELLKLKNFGRKSYTEVVPLFREVQSELKSKQPKTHEEVFALVDETTGEMLGEAYEALFTEDNDVTRFFKACYPSVKELHCMVTDKENNLLEIYGEFTMAENVEIRRMYARYLQDAMNRILDGRRTDNNTYWEYKSILAELLPRLEEFSYQDKAKFFITPDVRGYLQSVYVSMREKLLSVRAKNFVEHVAPSFEDLVLYFDSALLDYRNLCPGQSMMKTLTEVFNFNKLLKEQFDRYWQMSDEEVQSALLKRDYPYLSSVERRFVMEHAREYGVHPMFFLLYNYMRISEVRSNKIFSLMYGIFDGKERTLNELAENLNLSRERIRQIMSKKLEVHDTALIKNDGWKNYDALFSLPYITADSLEYLLLKEREHLRFDFRVFARLMQLLGEQYKTEIVGKVVVVINRKKMPSINIGDCIDTLCALVSSRYTNDIRIDVEASLNTMTTEEKTEATKLMSYIAKEGLNLEVDENSRILVHKNHIDVAEDLYTILARRGEPMSVDELFVAFKEMYPDHKYTESAQIRSWLFRHPNIKPIGHTSRYGLDNWGNVFYGTIRDLLMELLKESDVPIHIEQLYNAVTEHYPNTNIKSLKSLLDDPQGRFIRFSDGFYGLSTKTYDDSFIETNNQRQHFSFEERLADFCAFVDTYNRYPSTTNGNDEASLYRWLYYMQNVYEIKDEDKAHLEEVLARYDQKFIPRNSTESEFRNNCQRYKAYINSHHILPSSSADPELYGWMLRSKANYNSYVDHRRKYLTDLLNYILSLGFSI
ncbi:MAG: DNA-directed RNA polymerase subunit alpha C-terminal domain-containing protein [Bacteroidales bacterium]|nr:DNA-directed RNA polymerase subunit alpha C-terminal domain-containing protein [Bacteroidales bacterium]